MTLYTHHFKGGTAVSVTFKKKKEEELQLEAPKYAVLIRSPLLTTWIRCSLFSVKYLISRMMLSFPTRGLQMSLRGSTVPSQPKSAETFYANNVSQMEFIEYWTFILVNDQLFSFISVDHFQSLHILK